MPKVEMLKVLREITIKTEYLAMNLKTGQFERITITEDILSMGPATVEVVDWKDAPRWGALKNAKS